MESIIRPISDIARGAIESEEGLNFREVGFKRRTNLYVGAVVLLVLGTAAFISLRLFFLM